MLGKKGYVVVVVVVVVVVKVYSYALVYYIFHKSAPDIFNSISLIGLLFMYEQDKIQGSIYTSRYGRIIYQQ